MNSAAARGAGLSREMAVRASAALRNAKTAAARFQAAEAADSAGDIHTAALLYCRTALAKQAPSDMRARAKAVLSEYRAAAEKEFVEVLERIRYAGQEADGDSEKMVESINAALDDVSLLVTKYENVPVANKKLEREQHNLLRKNADVGKYLHEPVAARLMRDAKRYEADGHVCCAYICYREASKLMTCDSAKAAQLRLYELRKQPGVLQSVAECEGIRECHALFDKAQRIGKRKTYIRHAVKLYKQIVEQAPQESEVHKAALEELNKLTG